MSKEINLENPIFVYYIDVTGLSRQSSERLLLHVRDNQYTNITSLIFPIKNNPTRVEVIWKGTKYSDNKFEDPDIIKHLNSILQIVIDGSSDEQIKSALRDLKIEKIISN